MLVFDSGRSGSVVSFPGGRTFAVGDILDLNGDLVEVNQEGLWRVAGVATEPPDAIPRVMLERPPQTKGA